MVKIAIAGASGGVAQEVLDALVAANKHEILLFTRKEMKATLPGTKYIKTDYDDKESLVTALQGVHTVLSFIAQNEPTETMQKNLIDASIKAGVKRFAPSEWSSASFQHLSWYNFKAETRKYLEEINKDRKVLEYCLFTPSLFTNYFTYPYPSMKHVKPMEIPIDFQNRRALVIDGALDRPFTLTTCQDLANVVAQAVEYEGEWPVKGGIRGETITMARLLEIGEKIRGGKFNVEKIKVSEVEADTWTTTWIPLIDHPSIPPELVQSFSRSGTVGIMMALADGAFDTSDEWNKLLPDYKFTGVEELLSEAWRGKA